MKTVPPLERGLQVGFGHSSEPDVNCRLGTHPGASRHPSEGGNFQGSHNAACHWLTPVVGFDPNLSDSQEVCIR